jgi:hypothetical protein
VNRAAWLPPAGGYTIRDLGVSESEISDEGLRSGASFTLRRRSVAVGMCGSVG